MPPPAMLTFLTRSTRSSAHCWEGSEYWKNRLSWITRCSKTSPQIGSLRTQTLHGICQRRFQCLEAHCKQRHHYGTECGYCKYLPRQGCPVLILQQPPAHTGKCQGNGNAAGNHSQYDEIPGQHLP